MISALALTFTILSSPAQAVDGVKPIFDPTPKYSKALAAYFQDDSAVLVKPDMFMVGFYSMKIKGMSPLVQTKYTAAQMGICGTMLGVFDDKVGEAVKAATGRITTGSKDFDSFTEAEQKAINGALANSSSDLYPFNEKVGKEGLDRYMAGASLGSLCGYLTVWHISPKNETLLKFIGASVDGCVEAAGKPDGKLSSDVIANLKGFSRFKGKTYDAATMTEISKQIEITLKSSVPAKYRWE